MKNFLIEIMKVIKKSTETVKPKRLSIKEKEERLLEKLARRRTAKGKARVLAQLNNLRKIEGSKI